MKNFEFHVPTDILFGQGQEENLPKSVKEIRQKASINEQGILQEDILFRSHLMQQRLS